MAFNDIKTVKSAMPSLKLQWPKRFEGLCKKFLLLGAVMIRFLPLQNETIQALFSQSSEEIVKMPSPPKFHEDKQRAAILELAGKWVDSRPLEATIADIEEARTPGREIEPLKKTDCDGAASLSMTRTC